MKKNLNQFYQDGFEFLLKCFTNLERRLPVKYNLWGFVRSMYYSDMWEADASTKIRANREIEHVFDHPVRILDHFVNKDKSNNQYQYYSHWIVLYDEENVEEYEEEWNSIRVISYSATTEMGPSCDYPGCPKIPYSPMKNAEMRIVKNIVHLQEDQIEYFKAEDVQLWLHNNHNLKEKILPYINRNLNSGYQINEEELACAFLYAHLWNFDDASNTKPDTLLKTCGMEMLFTFALYNCNYRRAMEACTKKSNILYVAIDSFQKVYLLKLITGSTILTTVGSQKIDWTNYNNSFNNYVRFNNFNLLIEEGISVLNLILERGILSKNIANPLNFINRCKQLYLTQMRNYSFSQNETKRNIQNQILLFAVILMVGKENNYKRPVIQKKYVELIAADQNEFMKLWGKYRKQFINKSIPIENGLNVLL